MIAELPDLAHFKREQLTGLLSRAALDIASGGVNPAAAPRIPNEEHLRARIIKTIEEGIRARSPQASDSEICDKVVTEIDLEVDRLAEPIDDVAAVDRLSADAALPNDLYKFIVDEQVTKFFSNLSFNDIEIGRDTIRSPDIQEDFGPKSSDSKPSLISLFARWYSPGRDRDRFLLLVAAARRHHQIEVNHVLRFYPSDVPLIGDAKLADLFEKLARKYGVRFQVLAGASGPSLWSGHFLYHEIFQIPGNRIALRNEPDGIGPNDDVLVSTLLRRQNGSTEVSFGIGLNVSAYGRAVANHLKPKRG